MLGVEFQKRFDGQSVRGQLIDEGDIQIAVDREGERARYGSRGHHQHIGMRCRPAGRLALFLERDPLRDAEPVLFVDDNESELRESHVRLDQGMSPDDELSGTASHILQHAIPELFPLTAEEKADLDRKVFQKSFQRHEMLFREYLSRRHERRLIAVLNRNQHGNQRHDRLSAPDIALEQPVHGPGRIHIGRDFLDNPHLRLRQLERQRVDELAGEPAVDAKRDPRHPHLDAVAAKREHELQRKQLFEFQPVARPLEIVLSFGKMN